jgi:hypothetical protein
VTEVEGPEDEKNKEEEQTRKKLDGTATSGKWDEFLITIF